MLRFTEPLCGSLRISNENVSSPVGTPSEQFIETLIIFFICSNQTLNHVDDILKFKIF